MRAKACWQKTKCSCLGAIRQLMNPLCRGSPLVRGLLLLLTQHEGNARLAERLMQLSKSTCPADRPRPRQFDLHLLGRSCTRADLERMDDRGASWIVLDAPRRFLCAPLCFVSSGHAAGFDSTGPRCSRLHRSESRKVGFLVYKPRPAEAAQSDQQALRNRLVVELSFFES